MDLAKAHNEKLNRITILSITAVVAMGGLLFGYDTGVISGSQLNNDNFNGALPYLIFAIFSVATFIFVWRLVPETKGKTLEELESIWTGEKVFHKADEIEPDLY